MVFAYLETSVSDPDPDPLQEPWIRIREAKKNRDNLT